MPGSFAALRMTESVPGIGFYVLVARHEIPLRTSRKPSKTALTASPALWYIDYRSKVWFFVSRYDAEQQ